MEPLSSAPNAQLSLLCLRFVLDGEFCATLDRHGESLPSLERATKYNPMYESEATTGYSHYYRRYPDIPVYSSASAEASTDFSSEEMRHIYENSELTKEVCLEKKHTNTHTSERIRLTGSQLAPPTVQKTSEANCRTTAIKLRGFSITTALKES